MGPFWSAGVAAMNATNYLEYANVGLGHYSWRCSCGQSDVVPSLAVAYKSANLHRKGCNGHR
jgi:hypothetical protein